MIHHTPPIPRKMIQKNGGMHHYERSNESVREM